MKSIFRWLAVLVIAAPLMFAADPPAAPGTSDADASKAAELSEGLIYSVDRVPERTFDTARDVEVITQTEIQHANTRELGQLLERQLGFSVVRGESGSMPMVRGLAGKQIMFLVDGVKVNNATWRGASKEYLSIFDMSQIDRIEVVRGVVSVLGTESLGGVVNIITKKGTGMTSNSVTGSISARYASAEKSTGSTITAAAAWGALRLDVGMSATEAGNVEGGDGLGPQEGTEFNQRAGHLNGQWLLSRDKTISFNYQNARSKGETPGNNITLLAGEFNPSELSLFSASYQDLTSRGWEDSLRLTLYSNNQRDIRNVLLQTPPANLRRTQREEDRDQL